MLAYEKTVAVFVLISACVALLKDIRYPLSRCRPSVCFIFAHFGKALNTGPRAEILPEFDEVDAPAKPSRIFKRYSPREMGRE